MKSHQGKGDKSDEGYVIRNPHAGEEAGKNHDPCHLADRMEKAEKAHRHHGKNPGFLQARHHGHKGEKKAQYPEIDIGNIIHGGRHKKCRHKGQKGRETEDGVRLEKRNQFRHGHSQ